MCRSQDKKNKNDLCPELSDQSKWDENCPLSPRKFDEHIEKFISAMRALADDNDNKCRSILKELNEKDEKIKEWSIKHAQVAGRNRNKMLKIKKGKSIPEELRFKPRKPDAKLESKVFNDDNYHCRYCGIKLIPNNLLKIFAKTLNDEKLFSYGKSNETKHSIIHLCKPVADHVEPWNRGGETLPKNLVASCGPCNYGKHNFKLDEIGVTKNPFDKPAVKSTWSKELAELEYKLLKIK